MEVLVLMLLIVIIILLKEIFAFHLIILVYFILLQLLKIQQLYHVILGVFFGPLKFVVEMQLKSLLVVITQLLFFPLILILKNGLLFIMKIYYQMINIVMHVVKLMNVNVIMMMVQIQNQDYVEEREEMMMIKKRRKRDDDRKKPNPKNDDNNDDNNNNSTNTTRRYLDDHSTNTSVISAPTVSYNKPYVDARITMFDQEGDGWWFNDYLGISWYLADSTRTKLFHTGSLCNGTSGFCNLCLADGDYTLRVSGLKSTFLSWDFCGVRGSYGEELVFEVQDNKCYPIALLDLANSSSQVITYVFESTLEVCLKEEYLNLTDPKAVATITNTLIEVLNVDGASVIIEEVKDNDDNNNNNNKPSLPSTPTKSRRGSNSNHGEKKRRSKNDHDDKPSKGGDNDVDEPEVEVVYNHNIKFTITIKVQTDELHVDEVLDTYEKLLAESISNGTFISKLVSNSLVYGYTPFNFTSCAKSSEFTYVSAHFDFSLPFISSTLLFTPGLNSHIEASAIHNDYSAISLFFGSIVVGFIAFVGIVSKGLNGYNTLSNDSQHDIEFSSTHSTSSHGLLPFSNAIDMDQTISNPLGANAAREVQREQHVRSSL
mmetsp:Transcript_22391/g.23062  ORF Transcript_22391/g.23062 Transcript_22391/m.23062 type:complete len:599 (+) Transcript_22391:208-2004(+)